MSGVLVTGGRGFLGSHLCARLRGEGTQHLATGREWDLTDPQQAQRLFDHLEPDLVFHLAAEVGGIGANQANPARYWYLNLLMGAHVLEQACRHGVDKVVMVGTACSYPRDAPLPFSEASLWDGSPEETNAPYAIAKRALVTGAQAYRDQYGLNAITVIPANLYGPGDNFDLDTSHVIPALIRKLVAAAAADADEVQLWGDGSATREFLYIEDCADALVLAGDAYDEREPLNLGSGVEISISTLAATIAQLTGFHGRIVWDHGRPNGQPRRRLDSTRARELLGFAPATPLLDGLQRTIAWYRSGTAVSRT